MRPYDIFLGIWNTTGDVLETDAAPATTLFATDIYRWLPGGHFLLHEVDARFGDQVFRALEIVPYDAATQAHIARSYDDRGSIEDFTVELTGRNWHITGKNTRFNGQFTSDSCTLTGLWELQTGSGCWQDWIKLRLQKA